MRALTMDELEWVSGGFGEYDSLYNNFSDGMFDLDAAMSDYNSLAEDVIVRGRRRGINFDYDLNKLSKALQNEQFQACVRKAFITEQGHITIAAATAGISGAIAGGKLFLKAPSTGPVGAGLAIAGGAMAGEMAYLSGVAFGCFSEVYSDGIA